MNEIFHRTSIRKYTSRPVEADKIELLLRAAMAAPSAGNQQPWEFYVVTDKNTLNYGSELHRGRSGWKRREKCWRFLKICMYFP